MDGGSLIRHLLQSIIIFSIGGLGWGAAMWAIGERGYRRWEHERAS
jgi:hypothetical protein